MNDALIQFQRPMRDYIEYLEKITPRSIRLVEKIAARQMYFKNPFNEARGIKEVERVFEHMLKTVQSPRYKAMDYGFGRDGVGYIRWSFSYVNKGGSHTLNGMSEITFSDDGKITSHIDYWDAGEGVYEHIPLLGGLIRFVKSKISAL